jgi:hyperosmotically inducible protein
MNPGTLGALVATLLLLSAPVRASDSMGGAMDDSATTASVKAALFNSSRTHAGDIHVQTYGSIVQLSGFVRSQEEKDAAESLAAGVASVKRVINSLAVGQEGSVGEQLDDSVTTSRVKAALIDTAGVNGRQIEVETQRGVVQLSGFVASDDERNRAAKVAAGVDSVKSVENVLQLRPK